MQKTLVVGATGQLGSAVIGKLVARQADVRAFVRSEAAAQKFAALGVEAVIGDLRDAASLGAACRGVDVVVTTANAAVPTRKSDTFEAVERDGYRNLIDAARRGNVQRFVYTSVLPSQYEHVTPFFRYKRETEQRLAESGMDPVVFRADIFMDTAFCMMGSDIPVRGTESATVMRSFGFAANHFQKVRNSIERDHVAMIPGNGDTRHAFICVDDVANFLVSAAFSHRTGTFAIGGPEALTFLDVVRIYERILGVKLRVKKTPAPVFRALSAAFGLFSPAASNLMRLNYIAAKEDSNVTPESAVAFDVRLTSAESFLRAKSGLSARAAG
jgi:uncharacterized protein YbjT (DUF2867 family)